jgi:DNA-binding response OmpR family regulator
MKNILVADDDPITNLLITRELQKSGYGVLMSHDVVQASITLTRTRVDAVIVDVRMPGGTAFDVIRRMKNSTRLEPIPIIAISSNMNQEVSAALTRQGADLCMKKPVDLDGLQTALRELVSEPQLKIVHRSTSPQSPAFEGAGVEPPIVEQIHSRV